MEKVRDDLEESTAPGIHINRWSISKILPYGEHIFIVLSLMLCRGLDFGMSKAWSTLWPAILSNWSELEMSLWPLFISWIARLSAVSSMKRLNAAFDLRMRTTSLARESAYRRYSAYFHIQLCISILLSSQMPFLPSKWAPWSIWKQTLLFCWQVSDYYMSSHLVCPPGIAFFIEISSRVGICVRVSYWYTSSMCLCHLMHFMNFCLLCISSATSSASTSEPSTSDDYKYLMSNRRKGTWADCQLETILKALVSFSRNFHGALSLCGSFEYSLIFDAAHFLFSSY